MGGYAAPYCNNSAAKGYTILIRKRFLRNPERQAVYKIKNVSREDYQQTIHFFAKLIHSNFLQKNK